VQPKQLIINNKKMNQLQQLIAFTALLCVISTIAYAGATGENEKKIIKVDKSSIRPLKLSEIAESIHYIPLETNEKCQLEAPFSYVVHNEKVYVYDFKGDQGLYCFGTDGKFINKRTTIGRGQGEFFSVMNIEVHTAKNEIYIFDIMLQKIVVLSDDLLFKREIFFPGLKVKFIKLTSDNQLYAILEDSLDGKAIGCIAKFCDKGELIYSKEAYLAKSPGMQVLCNVGTNLIVAGQMENNIYELVNDKLATLYEINFDVNTFSKYKKHAFSDDENVDSTNADTHSYLRCQIMLFSANENYSVVMVSDEFSREKLLVSNSTSEAILFDTIVNDINGLCLGEMLHDAGEPNLFCQSVSAIDLIDSYEEKKGTFDFSEATKKLIEGLSPEDNKVLVLIKTK